MSLIKNIIVIFIWIPFTSFAQTESECIKYKELSEIAADFKQIKNKLKTKTNNYCESHLGAEWLQIIQSLKILKNMSQINPDLDDNDAFTYQAITDKDWWAYFTKRASKFVIQKKCEKSVVAYVIPFFAQKTIHLCPDFFKMQKYRQASVMMHEVRHFDGHKHVTCKRGNEKGSQGACDNSVTQKGSYAISLQTLVGMAKAEETLEEDKLILQALAVYNAFNKFNSIPDVKIEHSIYLSHETGEILKWTPADDEIERVAVLRSPSRVLNSYKQFTLFPLDPTKEAIRVDSHFTKKAERPGLFAHHYNTSNREERTTYDDVLYLGGGGILKDNKLLAACGRSGLDTQNLNKYGEFTRLISHSPDDHNMKIMNYLVSTTGELFLFECKQEALKITETDFKVPVKMKAYTGSFSLMGAQFVLLENGSLSLLQQQGKTLIPSSEPLGLPVENENWLSATPFSSPRIFN